MTKKQTNNLLSVNQAAKSAKVAKSTIYYHLNRSLKLPRTYHGGQVYLKESDLRKLYPYVQSGRKQRSSTTVHPLTDPELSAAFETLGTKVERIKAGEATAKEQVQVALALRFID